MNNFTITYLITSLISATILLVLLLIAWFSKRNGKDLDFILLDENFWYRFWFVIGGGFSLLPIFVILCYIANVISILFENKGCGVPFKESALEAFDSLDEVFFSKAGETMLVVWALIVGVIAASSILDIINVIFSWF